VSIKLLLIRHARVDFESSDFMMSPRGRQWDPPLGERGLEQAERLALRLVQMDRPAAILVSPFRRCRQTLAPYVDAARPALPSPIVDDDLGEVFVGAWEGMRFEDIVAGDEELARRFRDQEAMFSMAPGGESGPELRGRVVPAVERAIASVSSGTVMVVPHGGVINAYLGHLMGIPHDMFFLPDNSSINSVDADGDRREVRFLNDGRHLTDPGVFTPPARPTGARDR
jgi:probable phosphoglycerate mutase